MTDLTMRERKKEATKVKIQRAAIELIHQCGFAATTMQLVAEKADVALRTLYNYYPSKEAIVGSYLRDVVDGEIDRHWGELINLESTYDRLILVGKKTAAWTVDNPVLSEIYAADPRNYCYSSADEVPRSGMEELAVKIFEMGHRQGDLAPNIPIDVLARQLMGILYQGILTWLGDPSRDLFMLFKDGIDILYDGIKPKGVAPEVIFWGMFY